MKQSSTELPSVKISGQAKIIQDRLLHLVRAEISSQNGKIPFSKLMQMALYEPQLGYYQNNLQKFGAKGDFITAPEMGGSFAKCLAYSLHDYFAANAGNHENQILEIGAGSGILAVNLLEELAQLGVLPSQYFILEPSAVLQAQQQQQCLKKHPDYFTNICWLTSLPKEFCGIILANEVADAIPCERVIRADGQWQALGVSFEREELGDCLLGSLEDKPNKKTKTETQINNQKLPGKLQQMSHNQNYPEGYVTEYRPLVVGWLKALSACLKKGAIMLFDYGYAESELYHPQRVSGSLSCFINHHCHSNPYQMLGLQDITAHVDFTQIARVANENGLEVIGYTTQAGFLLDNGIVEFNEQFDEPSVDQASAQKRYQLSQELQQLLMPGEMGEVVKAILLARNLNTEIGGFMLQDRLHSLG